MKQLIFLAPCIVWFAVVYFCFSLAHEADLKANSKAAKIDCEERLAKELNTTAVYINDHCMVKGYGRADGRSVR